MSSRCHRFVVVHPQFALTNLAQEMILQHWPARDNQLTNTKPFEDTACGAHR
jgi:hypothetical protein